jgi:Ca-activated chloride channel family protein
MTATDDKPSRLERVKQEIRRLRADARGDRFALVAFAGRSYILTPLTVDDGAIELFLDNLDPSIVGQAGSALSGTIRQGVDLLAATRTGGDRALVIFSDGESFEPQDDAVTEAKRAAEQGVSIVTVGVGTAQGSTIPIREGNGIVQKRDENGEIVVTRYHPETLRDIAQAANGTFIDAGETDKATKIRRALSRLRGVHRAVESGRSQRPRFQLFVAPLLALLLLDTLLSERRGRRRRAAAAATAAAAASLLLMLAPVASARADDFADATREYLAKRFARAATLFRKAIEGGDRRPETLYNYGTALVAADSLTQAADVLERVTKVADPELRYRASFNLGLAQLKLGLTTKGDTSEAALDAALASYKKTLLMRPTDMDAKWNYELALRKKQSGGGGGGGGSSNSSGGKSNEQQNQPQSERPAGGLGQQQAEQLLNSASRDERAVQGKKQKQNRPQPPPGGKDW